MDILLGALVSLGIGGLVGLEREWRRKLTGIRTFMIISLLGFLSFSAASVSTLIVPVALSAIVIMSLRQGEKLETSTYIASLVIFILGGLVAIDMAAYAAGVSLIMMALLALRDTLHHFAYSFSEKEILDIVKMGALVLVIMPLLPNKSIDPWGLINPFEIWLMLIAILGLSFIGYMLVKFLGSRAGLVLTALLGGFASSTALTFEMTAIDKKQKSNLTGIAAFLGSSTMFLKVPLLLAVFSPQLALSVAPNMLIIFVLGVLISRWLLKKEKGTRNIKIKNPLDFTTAIKFVVFFMVASVLVYVGRIFYGTTGAYLASFVGGFTDIEPIALAAVNSMMTGPVSLSTAKTMVMLGAFANSLTKAGLMVVRGKKFTKRLGLLLVGLSLLLFFPI
ncbi:MAG: MgtC/SapB family protein [Candidatus Altiarchaeota archaeon]|nr:MgtC/SapB family protein [Candidatus Altiarchaeota archaeon]